MTTPRSRRKPRWRIATMASSGEALAPERPLLIHLIGHEIPLSRRV
jgi:hypothetical protein